MSHLVVTRIRLQYMKVSLFKSTQEYDRDITFEVYVLVFLFLYVKMKKRYRQIKRIELD